MSAIPKEEPNDNIHSEYKAPLIDEQHHQNVIENSPTPRMTVKRAGRRKINIEFIEDKSRRHITFSKRKAGIMKKAYELSTLTGTQVLLLVASETGHVYTFATPKLQPLITKPEGKNLIQACLNAPDTLQAQQTHQSAQMSPGTPSGYGHQADHSLNMNQPEMNNYSQPSPGTSPYGQHVDDDKNSIPYGSALQRTGFADMKPYQTASPSQHEHNDGGLSAYAYASQPMMNPGMARMPYNSGTLPTLSDRGSFGNLPYQSFQPQSPSINSYPGPSIGSNFPSHFPSSVSGPSQLFSKASNLPLSRHDGM